MTLGEIVKTLKRIYCSSRFAFPLIGPCFQLTRLPSLFVFFLSYLFPTHPGGHIGIQYVHIPDRHQCDWIRERVEIPHPWKYTVEEKRMILDRLMWSDGFENFIASKFPNEKRFGLEGCESLIPGMKALIDRSVDAGTKAIVLGMPHRGRLNVLANVVRKPIEAILNELYVDLCLTWALLPNLLSRSRPLTVFFSFFSALVLPCFLVSSNSYSKGTTDADDSAGGDVKYHLGANYVRPTPSGKKVSLSLVANPSHLECEDPVVLGKTRAIQHFEGDEVNHDTAMGVLLHGDAAFAGQGVVYESMGMHSLPNYGTGGTIHIVVNNQIGFTTDPRFSRSTPYCSDIAKSIDAPIFHVNGDNVEAVNFVCQLAADWRAEFKKDVVVDIVCYRKYGHNETDQPSFTQPRMYKAIAAQTPVLSKYIDRLVQEGSFTEKDIEEHKKWVWGMLEKAHEGSKDYKPSPKEWLSSSWDGFPTPKELAENIIPAQPTGADESVLKKIGEVVSTFPDGFTPHKNLARILKTRGKTVAEGTNIDWSTAEALAFGSLALEQKHVRISGQDVERGTFSQRHAVVHDQETEHQYIPLNHVGEDQAKFTVCNSHLSEFGVLGFELGYSLVSPDSLTIWEGKPTFSLCHLLRPLLVSLSPKRVADVSFPSFVRPFQLNSETLPTDARSSSTSSSLLERGSGSSDRVSSCRFLMDTMGKVQSTRLAESSDSSSSATTTRIDSLRRRWLLVSTRTATCRSSIRRKRPSVSSHLSRRAIRPNRHSCSSLVQHACQLLPRSPTTGPPRLQEACPSPSLLTPFRCSHGFPLTSYLLFDPILHQLILFFSKNLLRHPNARSDLSEMIGDTTFQRFIPEVVQDLAPDDQIKRVIICSGSSLFPILPVPEILPCPRIVPASSCSHTFLSFQSRPHRSSLPNPRQGT
jgi:hypothetical protein